MEITSLIQQKVKEAIRNEYGVEIEKVMIEHPEDGKFGDYATSVALELTKTVKQSPITIANSICYRLDIKSMTFSCSGKDVQIFSNIEVAAPGFINFKLSDLWLQNVLHQASEVSVGYGSSTSGQGERVALEHSNVNPNKAAHIGHLRNACIGQFVERVYEFLDYDVEVQYYCNDVGVQVATSSMGLDKIKDISPFSYSKYDHYAWDVYAKMETLIEEDGNLKKERENLLIKLDDPDSPEFKRQKDLAKKILVEQLKTFQNLGFDYDVVVNESDIIASKIWEKAFGLLKKNENVYLADDGLSKGCWLVKMSPDDKDDRKVNNDGKKVPEHVEEDKIIVRSNGVPTYTGKDIAYHMWKFGLLDMDFSYEKFDYGTQVKPLWTTSSKKSTEKVSFTGVSIVLDVIDGHQTYAIDAVKKSLKYLGYKDKAERMTHINYGFAYLSPKTASNLGIDTSDNKSQYAMSGRKGWGIKIDDFIRMVDEKIKLEHGTSSGLQDVRNGAIKFEMLKYNTFQDIVFDLDTALNIKGFSGPYIQYTHARASSIIEKSNFTGVANDVYHVNLEDKEREVLRCLYKFPEIVDRSAVSFAPNLVCNYLFELCQHYNHLYNDLSILNAPKESQREFRILLTFGVKQILKTGLFLLGINAPDRM